MIKEIPILFSTPMVQSILNDEKSISRRLLPVYAGPNKPSNVPHTNRWYFDDMDPSTYFNCRYGAKGDLLWVRESFAKISEGFEYKADDGRIIDGVQNINLHDKYKPSIHMPKLASRIWLHVNEIRVERLHGISEADIISEGVRVPHSQEDKILFCVGDDNRAIDFMPEGWSLDGKGIKATDYDFLFAHWAELWCKINGRDSWEMNPWVFVIDFKVLSKTGKPKFKSLQSIN